MLYFEDFLKKDYEKVTYKKGVVQLSAKEVTAFDRDTAQLTVLASVGKKVSDGTIVVFKNPDTGIQTAGKLKRTGTANTYILREVKAEDVVSSAQVSDVKEVTLNDLAVSNGWKKSAAIQKNPDRNVVFASTKEQKSKGFTIQLKTEQEENEKGKEEKLLKIEATSKDGIISYEVPKNWKMPNDAEIDAKLNVDEIKVYGSTDFEGVTNFTYAEAGMQINSSFDGTVSTPEQSISLAEVEVPLANGALFHKYGTEAGVFHGWKYSCADGTSGTVQCAV